MPYVFPRSAAAPPRTLVSRVPLLEAALLVPAVSVAAGVASFVEVLAGGRPASVRRDVRAAMAVFFSVLVALVFLHVQIVYALGVGEGGSLQGGLHALERH